MKKIMALSLISIMTASVLTGCGGSSKYLVDANFSKYVDLCEYKGVETTQVTFEVTDEEVLNQINNYMYSYITYEPITGRAAKSGDVANIDYEVTVDGSVWEEVSASQAEIVVGEGYVYPELDDAIAGMKTGESKEVEVTFTADYVEESYVGKEANVKVTLNEIKKEIFPEYNAEFVASNTEYATMEEYEESVREEIYDAKYEQYRYFAIEEIINYVIDKSEFDGYPDALYDKCKKAYDDTSENYAAMYGMEVDEYLANFGITEEVQKQEIEATVQYELVISAIAQKENIDCTDEEVDEYVESLCEDYGYLTIEEFYKDYPKEDMGYLLIYEKVCDFLLENAKISEITEEEYYNSQMTGDYIEDLDGDALDGDAIDGIDIFNEGDLDDQMIQTDEVYDELESDLENRELDQMEDALDQYIEDGVQQ